MTVQQLMMMFPEVPAELQDEPLLAQYADTFENLLRVAQNPGACSADYTPENHYYLKLIGPFRLLMYGLSTKEKVLSQLQERLDQHQADPDGFAQTLVMSDSIV